MFLRHDPSSPSNATGATLAAVSSAAISLAPRQALFGRRGTLDIAITGALNFVGCVTVGLLRNFAPLQSGAWRQPT